MRNSLDNFFLGGIDPALAWRHHPRRWHSRHHHPCRRERAVRLSCRRLQLPPVVLDHVGVGLLLQQLQLGRHLKSQSKLQRDCRINFSTMTELEMESTKLNIIVAERRIICLLWLTLNEFGLDSVSRRRKWRQVFNVYVSWMDRRVDLLRAHFVRLQSNHGLVADFVHRAFSNDAHSNKGGRCSCLGPFSGFSLDKHQLIQLIRAENRLTWLIQDWCMLHSSLFIRIFKLWTLWWFELQEKSHTWGVQY